MEGGATAREILKPAPNPTQVAPWPIDASSTATQTGQPQKESAPEPAHSLSSVLSIRPIAVTDADMPAQGIEACLGDRLPGLIGDAPCMLEVSRRIRLVAPRSRRC